MAKIPTFGGLGQEAPAAPMQAHPQQPSISPQQAVASSYAQPSFSPELQNELAAQLSAQARRDPDDAKFVSATTSAEALESQGGGGQFIAEEASAMTFLGEDPFTGLANYQTASGGIVSSTRFPSAAAASKSLSHGVMRGTVQVAGRTPVPLSAKTTAEAMSELNNSLNTEVAEGSQSTFDPDATGVGPALTADELFAVAYARQATEQAAIQAAVQASARAAQQAEAIMQAQADILARQRATQQAQQAQVALLVRQTAQVQPQLPINTAEFVQVQRTHPPQNAQAARLSDLTIEVKPVRQEPGQAALSLVKLSGTLAQGAPEKAADSIGRLAVEGLGYAIIARLDAPMPAAGLITIFSASYLASQN